MEPYSKTSDLFSKKRKSSNGDEGDRISSLPDDIIIHQILGRSESPFKQSAQLSVLSKRWNHIYHSQPNLEFDTFGLESKQPEDLHAAMEACTRFFECRSKNSIPTESVTIIESTAYESDPLPVDFLNKIFDLTAKVSPRKIEINLTTRYVIPQSFLIRNEDDDHGDDNYQFFRRLTILKLGGCSFRAYQAIENPNFQGFGISLKELYLTYVAFPEDGILDAMVSAASRLETLSLSSIYGIKRFRVKDHPSLKTITAQNFNSVKEIEITGLESLENLKIIFHSRISSFRISSTPNLKDVDIKGPDIIGDLVYEEFLKLISECQSLKSIAVENIAALLKFKIVNTNQLRKVKLTWNFMDIELDSSEADGDLITSFVIRVAQTISRNALAD
ncbi:hypothetical protein LINGRAHAP2_LOCUS28812 [Linum grandiflorum]